MTDHPPISPETNRQKLITAAIEDAQSAVAFLQSGDVLAADIMLKLAIDELADTGLIP